VHSRYTVIARKEGRLADSERVCACALWADADKRIHNVGKLMWQGSLGAEPPAFGDSYNFLMKITRF